MCEPLCRVFKKESRVMRQISEVFYAASNGEVVTIEVTPQGVAPETVLGTKDGRALPNRTPGTNVVTFVFPVEAAPNRSDTVIVLCSFPGTPADDPNADPQCTFLLRDADGGQFQGPTIRKSDANRVCEFLFHVPASPVDFVAAAVRELQPTAAPNAAPAEERPTRRKPRSRRR